MNEIFKSINDEFFPTPKSLLDRIESDFGDVWKDLQGDLSILEPSAGRGDIVDWLRKKPIEYEISRYCRQIHGNDADIDCIEIDPVLRSTLKEKRGINIIHDDFLTFETAKKYDLIFMNPPFSNADRHLLKAIHMQEKYGGMVVCIINAETIKNPYSSTRKILAAQLEKYSASIKFYDGAFAASDAERKTDVEIAVIVLQVPIPESCSQSFIFEKLDKAKIEEAEKPTFEDENSEIVQDGLDYLDSYIKQFNEEISAGIALIKEFSAYTSVRKLRFGNVDSECETEPLTLRIKGEDADGKGLNCYVEAVRLRYWKALFSNPKFVGKLTGKMQNELMAAIREMRHYDFTMHNILELMTQIRDNTLKGIEESLMNLFETFSSKYSYLDETSSNIHYYNGWKTNKAHKVNKKVVIPMRGVWSALRYSRETHWSLSSYSAWSILKDLAKALDYIASPEYSAIDTHQDIQKQICLNFNAGITANIVTKYFILTFYKKGTCHIVFRDEELLEKFNLYIGKQKAWLPPSYGRKAYKDLDEEERAVADSFSGGEEGYNKIYNNQATFLVERQEMLLLTGVQYDGNA